MNNNKIYIDSSTSLKETLHKGFDFCRFLPPFPDIIIKPNLVRAFPSGSGTITDVRIVKALIDVLLERYALDRIIVAESSSLSHPTHRAFKVSGYTKLQGYQKIVSLCDVRNEKYQEDGQRLRKLPLLNKKTVINVPVLKGHPQVILTCCFKNLKGFCCDEDKKKIHLKGLNVNLPQLIEFLPHFNVVDATITRHSLTDNGVSKLNTIIMGHDPLLVDSVAAKIVGLDIHEIPYLANSLGNKDMSVETNRPVEQIEVWRPFTDKVTFWGSDIYLGDACNLCLEAAINVASSPFRPCTLQHRIFKKVQLYVSLMLGKTRFPRTILFPKQRNVLVLGRLEPQVELPVNEDTFFVGECSRTDCRNEKRFVKGCPPAASELYARSTMK